MSATSLHIVYDCFPTMMAEVSGCERDRVVHRASNIYCLALSRKSLLMSCLGGLALGWLLLLSPVLMLRYLFSGPHFLIFNFETRQLWDQNLFQVFWHRFSGLAWPDMRLFEVCLMCCECLCLAIELSTCLLTEYLLRTWGFSSYIVYAPHYLSKIQKVLEHSWPQVSLQSHGVSCWLGAGRDGFASQLSRWCPA